MSSFAFRALPAAALLAALAAPAGAQDTSQGTQPYRFTVEPYLTQLWLDDGVGGREGVGGVGARLLFNRSEAARAARSLLGRATAGVFVTYTGEQKGVSTLQAGVLGQSSILPDAAARGTLDPVVSLGVGVFRTDVDGVGAESNLAVSPGIGTRLRLLRGLGLRGDLRAPVVFGSDVRVQLAAEGGLYFSF